MSLLCVGSYAKHPEFKLLNTKIAKRRENNVLKIPEKMKVMTNIIPQIWFR